MRSGFLDALTRLVMLVLAAMVSLSIIGAIATMSEGGGGPGGFPVDSPPQPVAPETNQAAPAPADSPGGGLRRPDSQGVATVAPAAAEAADDGARWLEVIAYVLFAIAGLAALLALILWRLFAELRRAADAIERLAARDGGR